jgi:hypothetical protein
VQDEWPIVSHVNAARNCLKIAPSADEDLELLLAKCTELGTLALQCKIGRPLNDLDLGDMSVDRRLELTLDIGSEVPEIRRLELAARVSHVVRSATILSFGMIRFNPIVSASRRGSCSM